jgi:fatty acid elongase 3
MSAFAFETSPWYHRDALAWSTPFVYATLVLLGLRVMKDRKPWTLQIFSVVHSGFLCVLSLVMFLGIAYGAFQKLSGPGGAWSLFCDASPEQRGVLPFWVHIYWLSKFPELLDTAILVLRKKPVIFLHVFHHAVMTLMPFLWLKGNWTLVWFGCWMNCGIHVYMYFYYAASAGWGYNPWWKKLLTSAQIGQFMLVLFSIVLFLWTRSLGYDCKGDYYTIWFSQGVNIVFLSFFVKFFIDTYTKSRKATQ